MSGERSVTSVGTFYLMVLSVAKGPQSGVGQCEFLWNKKYYFRTEGEKAQACYVYQTLLLLLQNYIIHAHCNKFKQYKEKSKNSRFWYFRLVPLVRVTSIQVCVLSAFFLARLTSELSLSLFYSFLWSPLVSKPDLLLFIFSEGDIHLHALWKAVLHCEGLCGRNRL